MLEREMFSTVEVDNRHCKKEFLEFPSRLYKHEPNWIRPIDQDVEDIFNPVRNTHLSRGESIRWLLKNYSGETVGRIAAFYDPCLNREDDLRTGGIGFFECINDRQGAFLLFDIARKWLKSKGIEAMDGPVNFGVRDNFWGCLTDGFHEPVHNMPFNFPYYKDLFEGYGFRNYFNQYTYRVDIQNPDNLHPVVRRSANRILQNPDYSFKLIEKGKISYASDFMTIYNKTWKSFSGSNEINEAQAENLLEKMGPIIDERLIIYGYYKDEPVAFFVMIPDIGQLIKKYKGKWTIWNKIDFFWNLKIARKVDRIVGRIFGVVPEHQGKGVEGALVLTFEKEVHKHGFPYKYLELNWIGDFNPIMMKISELIGGTIYKTHITYRYLFDRKKEFHRAPLVNTVKNNRNEVVQSS